MIDKRRWFHYSFLQPTSIFYGLDMTTGLIVSVGTMAIAGVFLVSNSFVDFSPLFSAIFIV